MGDSASLDRRIYSFFKKKTITNVTLSGADAADLPAVALNIAWNAGHEAVKVGALANVAGSGIPLSATYTAALRVYADDNAAAIGAASTVRAGLFRLLRVAAVQTEAEFFGLQGQVVSRAAGTYDHNDAAVLGSLEHAGTAGTYTGTEKDNIHAGVLGRVGVVVTGTVLSATGVMAGLAAMSNTTNGYLTITSGGVFTGLYVGGFGTTQKWDYGIFIEDTRTKQAIDAIVTLSSQTLENINTALTLVSDSTFLTGDDITYSSARGSSILKLVGTWTGASGGFEGIDIKIATSGALAAAGDGAIGVKAVVTNTAALADGSIYGGQFIAKHNHATNDMTAQAALIGLETIAYNSAAGDVGTAFGLNVVMHNYGAGGAGSVHAGIQIVLDQAGGTKATEATGIRIWNMAGTWDAALRLTGAFGVFVNFDDATTCFAAITVAASAIAGQILVTMANGNTGYINVYSTTGT